MQFNQYNATGFGNTYTQVDQNKVLRNTYRLLGLSLLPTLLGAFLGVNTNFASTLGFSGLMVSLFAPFILLFVIQSYRNSATGVYLLLGFTFLEGFSIAPILQHALHFRNGLELIGLAVGGTSLSFLAMSALGTSMRQVGWVASTLSIGSVILMGAIIASLFFHTPAFMLAIAAAFVVFSSLSILFTVNQVVRGGETSYVSATLSVYISLLNIFINLLQILMAFSNDRDR